MDRRLLLLIAVCAAAFAGWWFVLRPQAVQPVEWQGYAEADFIKPGPTQQGLITQVHVARGDRIAKGAPLFDQDDADDRAAVDQIARQLAQAEDQLANLQNGGKPTEIQQAQANLADAEAARDKTQTDLARNQSLLKTGAAAAQLVDQETADLRSGNAKVRALEAALAQLQAPMGREGEIKAQNSAVEAAQAALVMARWRLDQRHVASPVSGAIADVLALPGETLAAGAPVVSILPPENIFVRFFVPEPALSSIHQGDQVAILCDGCPPDLTATVSFIAPQAEYTPPVIYSESTRGKFVFQAEARPKPDQAPLLNPGQPVSVRPKIQAPRR
ncbi:HlyD family secretion protein [Methylocapsa sp. S129]|uniref:HlyD family secretion protein n=1 Tax=Methylocapsa sp. S129 TaxID=1641869 RepID=UPI00131B5B7B|nr:HlyD family efflux transporter periplasmic adaptor subunit [Methylocapsa sp. S129]